MPGKDLLGDSDAKEAIHAFDQEIQHWQYEVDQLRFYADNYPQAKLGRALMPPGSSRERLFIRVQRFRHLVRTLGFGGTVGKVSNKVLVKLKLSKPKPLNAPQTAIEAKPTAVEGGAEKVRAVLAQSQLALPALQQYHASLNLSAATRKDKGPSYVEFSTPEEAPPLLARHEQGEDSPLRRGGERRRSSGGASGGPGVGGPGLAISTGLEEPASEFQSQEIRDPRSDIRDDEVKLIAFYLPQFHPIPENDSEWGRGFTEWNNVTRAIPQFRGQYQPHLPEDLGFYDLRIEEVQERQVELAKNYGIYGFAMYYYWFAGKRVLEKPLDNFVQNPNIDFPFCLIWANENWTRRWDGHEDDVFLAQVHTPESDVEFIKDAEKYLRHANYIRVEGKPLLIVYKCQLLPNAAETVQRWRDYARTSGLGELYLVAAQTMGFTDPTPFGFDAAMQFPPHNEHMKPNVRLDFWKGIGPVVLNKDFDGGIYTYPGIVEMKLNNPPETSYKLYEAAFPMWDNTARRPTNGWIYAYSTPELYRLWLTRLCNNALARPNPAERMVFLNAWNEWAEGAHLEPDRRYGYAYLKATRDARAIAERAASGSGVRDTIKVPTDQHLCEQLYGPSSEFLAPSSESLKAREPDHPNTQSPEHPKAREPESPEPRAAVFVYQMGKVGSMSIVTELERRNLGQPIIHSHMLNDFDRIAENACKQYPNPVDVLYEVQRGKMIREWMSQAGPDAKWNVITMTREPVGRNISAFFQNIEQLLPNIEARLEIGDLFVDELHELFLHVFNSRAPEGWFDSQLKPVFGIDVYSEPYDFENGYKILTSPLLARHEQGEGPGVWVPELATIAGWEKDGSDVQNPKSKIQNSEFRVPGSEHASPNTREPESPEPRAKVLVIRMEDLTRSIQPAMQSFLSLPDFPARKENRADQKYYSHAANIFKQKPLPVWYVDAMYSTRYATHFYTEQEIETLKEMDSKLRLPASWKLSARMGPPLHGQGATVPSDEGR